MLSSDAQLTKNGSLVVRLKKALYGCTESAKKWNDLLTKTLRDMGFVQNRYDECVFLHHERKILLCVYVDDMYITAQRVVEIERLQTDILQLFPDGIDFHYGDKQNYVGMSIDVERARREVHIQMENYTERVCERYGAGVGRAATSPANIDIFDQDETEQCDQQYQDIFHSTVAAALYLAKHARPDILLAVSALSSRVNKTTKKDKRALERMLGYLIATKTYAMTLVCRANEDSVFVIECYIDASFGVHSDGKSHSGTYISLGNGGIFFKSAKQNSMVKSAWEAELVAQSDGVSQAVWTYRFCNELGAGKFRVVLYSDNMGTIASIKKGKPSNDKSRHVQIRYFWIKELLENPDFILMHKPTELMIADVLTKPLVGEAFAKAAGMLMGHAPGERILKSGV